MTDNATLIGSWLNSGSTTVAELMAESDLDYVTIDLEHAPICIEKLVDLLRAIRSGSAKCKAFVRTPGHEYQDLKRYMDSGADGVIVPFVNNATIAQKIVDAVKYPPQGKRGVGFARDNGYGMHIMQKLKSANNDSFVCIQIEHIDGIKNLDEIFNVSGIDAAFIGPYDLSSSMGIPGDFNHPDFKKTISTFLQSCKKHNIIAGIHVVQPNPNEVIERLHQGYKMIAYSLDIAFLTDSINKGLGKIRRKMYG